MKADSYWFQWERQATVHPILLCMEAWMQPIEAAYGKPWPTAVIIYNKDLVGWYDPWQELLDYGQHCIDRFIQPLARQQLETEINRQARELEGMFQMLDDADLTLLDDSALAARYEEIHSRWIDWFVPGGLVEPVGHQGEKLLQARLAGRSDTNQLISLLTTTTLESFSKQELQELLRMAVAKKQGKDIRSLLAAHAKKYYWIHNNYSTTEVLGVDFFENELKIIEEKYPHPEIQLEEMEKEPAKIRNEKNRLVEELAFSESEKNLIELLDLFAWYQDCRKGYTMRMLHYLNAVLAEIGRRKGFTLLEMKYTLASEIPLVLSSQMDRTLLSERMQRCLFYWNSQTREFVYGAGSFALEKEKEIFHSLKHEEDILEVSGMVASKGIVRGRARVTMDAKDAAQIQPGEILITSMTTPDFVTALKRAVAIVTNEGGVLCHAAVVSREFGIPCIVGTAIATKVFKTGDLIEVDGDLGVVRKIKH